MRVSNHNLNPRTGDESYLLKFESKETGQTAGVLIDSGEGVDVDEVLEDDEYLSAVLLTHAHTDHYMTLPENIRDAAPIYTSEATASCLDITLREAEKYVTEGSEAAHPGTGETWDTDAVLNRVEAIDSWEQIIPSVRVRPMAVGHTPGATGFIVEFNDAGSKERLMITGDFTFRDVGGFDGIEACGGIDGMIVNSVSARSDADESANNQLTESLRKALECANAGKQTVITADGLVGVHYAALLGSIIETYDLQTTVTVVGHTAKLYQKIGYGFDSVEIVEVYDDVEDVVCNGTICIGGPSNPDLRANKTSGQLCRAVKDDVQGVIIHIGTENTSIENDVSCVEWSYAYSSHPSFEDLVDFIRQMNPISIISAHKSYNEQPLIDKLDCTLTWSIGPETEHHAIFEDGEWQAPPWVKSHVESNIREVNASRHVGEPFSLPELPSRSEINLQAEGVDTDVLSSLLMSTDSDTAQGKYSASAPNGLIAQDNGAERNARTDGHGSVASDPSGNTLDRPEVGQVRAGERPDADSDVATPDTADTNATSEAPASEDNSSAAVGDDRLDELTQEVRELKQAIGAGVAVEATAVEISPDTMVLRVDADTDLEHGETTTIRLDSDLIDSAAADK